MSKFRYTVTPVGVIKLKSLGNVGIRSPKTLDLTLDEVKTCLKKAKVYRRFNGTLIKKVTLSNCERLHNEEYIPEEDYKDFVLKNKSKDRGTVKDAVENTVKNIDNITKDYAEKKKEEYKNDAPKIEKFIEEVSKSAVEESEVKDETKSEETTENVKINSSKTNVNINKNKKHK